MINLVRLGWCGLILGLCACTEPNLQQHNDALELLAKRNYGRAALHFKSLADNGYAPAQFRLGLMLLHGYGLEQNAKMAAYWLDQAARQNDVGGQYALARLYLQNSAAGKNEILARQWMQRLAERGFVPAQYQLAILYAGGKGGTTDLKQAHHWLVQAANQHHRLAIKKLIHAYRKGELGLNINPAQASYWRQRLQHSWF